MTRSRKPGRTNYGRGTCPCCEKRVALNPQLKIDAHNNKRGRDCIGRNSQPINPGKPIKAIVFS